jgi:hypothetical protein
VTLGLGAVGEGRIQGTRKSDAGAAARRPPWRLAGRPRGTGIPTALALVGGSRRCPLPASLEGVGGGPGRTNQAGRSPVAGADPPERNHRVKSRTASPQRVAPRVLRGARPGRRDRLPPEHPDPSLWAGPGKAGLKRGRSQAELGPRRLPRTLPAGPAAQGLNMALCAAHHARAVTRVEGPLIARRSVGGVPVGPTRASGPSAPWCRLGPHGAQDRQDQGLQGQARTTHGGSQVTRRQIQAGGSPRAAITMHLCLRRPGAWMGRQET